MNLLHLVQNWLQSDPAGTNQLLIAVVAVVAIWILFERVGLTARKYR